MTIASCIVLPEGVVFGVDSTTSADLEYGYHYLNHNQKLFEVGVNSTLGVMTWGLSNFRETSHRTLIANLADELTSRKGYTVASAAALLLDMVWQTYQTAFAKEIAELREIESRQISSATNSPNERSKDDDDRYLELKDGLYVGFCLGGYALPDRTPYAFWFQFDPTKRSPGSPDKVVGELFTGQPNVFRRLTDGFDFETRAKILNSPFWTGGQNELDRILEEAVFMPPQMTIRDGVDFVHFSIYTTIKALKFSANGQICGGPIELAVITTDRPFRWVRHKVWDSAVGYDGP